MNKKLAKLYILFMLFFASLYLPTLSLHAEGFNYKQETIDLYSKVDIIIDNMYKSLNNPTDIEKALYLHDWITTHIEPEHGEKYHINFAYDGIIEGHGGCNGFSNSYRLLMHRASISCNYIHSNNHDWNIIWINNKAYYVDCTWDSQTMEYYQIGPPERDNFLKSRDFFINNTDHNAEFAGTIWTIDSIYNTDVPDYCKNLNLYETDISSDDYDNYDWSNIAYTFDDSVFNISYPRGNVALKIDMYEKPNGNDPKYEQTRYAIASYSGIYLITVPVDQDFIDHYQIPDSDTRYIHDIENDGTTITYHTWLKANPVKETEETHTLDWSKHFPAPVYTVTFQDIDGKVLDTQHITYGEKASPVDAPKIEHKTFLNWFNASEATTEEDSGNVPFDFTRPIIRDYIFQPKYENQCHITLEPEMECGYETTELYVDKGSVIPKPEDPVPPEGYTFTGWYYGSNPWDFSSPVTMDMELTGQFERTHTIITYMVDGKLWKKDAIKYGTKPVKPADPQKEDYVFNGWYKNSDLTNEYRFNSNQYSNITLYGAFKETEKFSVTFHKDNGEPDLTVMVPKRKPVDKPDDPERNGYIFKGWFSDPELKTPFDFSKSITEATDAYAKWQKEKTEIAIAVKQKTDITSEDCLGKAYDKYEILDKKLASVSKTGLLAGKKPGKTVIYGLIKSGKTYHRDTDNPVYVTIEAVTVQKTNKTITATKCGKIINVSKCFEATSITPTSYTSSKESIAKVNKNGILTTISKGSTKITAYYGEGKNAAKFSITVKVTALKLNKSTATVVTGRTLQLKLSNIPKTESVNWLSSDSESVSVSNTGKLNVLSYNESTGGKVKISAIVDEVSYDCDVTVKKPRFSVDTISLKSGKTAKLKLKDTNYKISDCRNWRSEYESVAVIDSTGKITAISTGSTVISTEIGGITISVPVSVNGGNTVTVPVVG